MLELCREYDVISVTLYKWLKNPPVTESKKPIVKIKNKPKDVCRENDLLRLHNENEI